VVDVVVLDALEAVEARVLARGVLYCGNDSCTIRRGGGKAHV
jgi:hypothetical protein